MSRQRKPTPKRQLMICRKIYRPERNLYIGRRNDWKEVPTLRLQGHWLQQSGFRIGHLVDVSCEAGRLTITIAAKQRYKGV